MNYLQLPDVRRIAGPEEYPNSRAKVKVGEQWYIVIDRHGPLLKPFPVRYNFTDDPMMGMQMVGYRCDLCKTTFMAHDHEGYIHKCCEVE